MSDLLTAAEVADRLSITEDMVKRRTRKEQWPHIKFSGKTIRYTDEHLESIIEKYEHVATAEPAADQFGQTSRSKAATA